MENLFKWRAEIRDFVNDSIELICDHNANFVIFTILDILRICPEVKKGKVIKYHLAEEHPDAKIRAKEGQEMIKLLKQMKDANRT